jgi:hypothetical protein
VRLRCAFPISSLKGEAVVHSNGAITVKDRYLDSPLLHPNDVLVIDDFEACPWLLVAGTDALGRPGAVVAAKLEFLPRTLRAARTVRLDDGGRPLASVNGLTQCSDGAIYVYDSKTPAIRPLLDENDDGVPDRIGVVPVLPEGAPNLSLNLSFDALRTWLVFGRHIAGVRTSSGEIVARDLDHDGVYEDFHQLGSEVPGWTADFETTPVAGARVVHLTARGGLRLRVRRITPTGEERVIGETVLEGQGMREGLVSLCEDLTQGALVWIEQGAEAAWGLRMKVPPRDIQVFFSEPDACRADDTPTVTVRGNGMELVGAVRFDGAETKFVFQDRDALSFVKPKTSSRRRWIVELLPADSKHRQAAFAMRSESLPR